MLKVSSPSLSGEGVSSSDSVLATELVATTVREITHFAALSILRPEARSSKNLWGSKVLAKSLQTALREPPSQQLRRAATRKPAARRLTEAFWQLAVASWQLAVACLAARRPYWVASWQLAGLPVA